MKVVNIELPFIQIILKLKILNYYLNYKKVLRKIIELKYNVIYIQLLISDNYIYNKLFYFLFLYNLNRKLIY